ncbi:NDP-hexose 2,3-dehydratase family protein [Nocardiopsis dassonvillei]|uniref:NDP-hexose 2,3-dehydratase family protein n=1 Tax=Nocardiopsis dassonvillei TaxID=2014 RepID=UPI003630037B
MSRPSADARARPPGPTQAVPWRLAESVHAGYTAKADLSSFFDWFHSNTDLVRTRTQRIPLNELDGWRSEPDSGDLVHDSGRFFRVQGLEAHVDAGPVRAWDQPIIVQPEIGLLGVLAQEFDGVLHFLTHAKAEPGNRHGLQLAPTVQATRSNYTRVHGGRPVPYLDYFRGTARYRVLADVRQSEQGYWFHRKRNRNMVLEVPPGEEVPVLPGFHWLTLGQLHRLLAVEDLVNMDVRTVLSCLPFAGRLLTGAYAPADDDFRAALVRSCDETEGARHSDLENLSWITAIRSNTGVYTRTIPLNRVRGWHRTEDAISDDDGLFFDVIGVNVEAVGREVGQWRQPMLAPRSVGLAAFLAARIEGVLHVLVQTRVEPGFVDTVELAPTVQCNPERVATLVTEGRPRFLIDVLDAAPSNIRFDTVLSEEGGRFYGARTRYMIVEADCADDPLPPGYRWMALHQLVRLLQHSHYLNVEARTLVACLHSLFGASTEVA